MGNSIKKHKSVEVLDSNKKSNSQFSLLSFGDWSNTRGSQSYSRRSNQSIRPRRCNDVTVSDHLSSSKTYWPVPYIESLFLPHFKLDNTNNFKTKYTTHSCLARGAFGKVYRVVKNDTEEEFALKILSKSQIIRDGTISQLRDEVDIQTICGHHPFIVKCNEFWQSRRLIFLLSEYIPCGELFETIVEFNSHLTQIFIAEIAYALDFLHNAGVIYRDLKPENILLDNDYHIKITDFGLSKWLKLGNKTRTICGTLQYMAPEILCGELYGHVVDWWALGIIACRMMTNRYPTLVHSSKTIENDTTDSLHCIDNSNNQTSTASKTTKATEFKITLPDCVQQLDPASRDILNRLLNCDPKYRIKSLMELERIAMFKGFDMNSIKSRKIAPRSLVPLQSQPQSTTIIDDEFEKFSSSVQ